MYGGVAVIVRTPIAAVVAASQTTPQGEWIRVAPGGFQLLSAYKQPGLPHEDTVISGPWLMGGDFNKEPREDPLRPSSFDLHASVLYPHNHTELDDSVHEPEPLAMRWASHHCID